MQGYFWLSVGLRTGLFGGVARKVEMHSLSLASVVHDPHHGACLALTVCSRPFLFYDDRVSLCSEQYNGPLTCEH